MDEDWQAKMRARGSADSRDSAPQAVRAGESTVTTLPAQARQWLASGRPAVIVEMERVNGSAPRAAGTRMLVCKDAIAGSIGGGHLELDAIRVARDLLATGGACHVATYALGPSLGQCCGGSVSVRWTLLSAQDLGTWPSAQSRFELCLFGAGHVGRALVRVLATLPCTVRWIDERCEAFAGYDGPLPDHIQGCCVDSVVDEVAEAPPDASFLVMTHSHEIDCAICEAVLKRGDFRFLGLIGSRSKRSRFTSRWRERGIPESAISRLVCPIGIGGVEGKEPEVIALAVAAQLLRDVARPVDPA